ncbi:hypothetical protein MiSe_85580 [Microseira wollei NIES-4236]|uniref:Uncharacterized protein n=1 Tax=Microseira wollei NIES-4236 TaxID=2530354 RepID=A0AAV3XM48_9CYAN|nr:hypothetical protein MiSe_85580 [Microseira wollei NIES-4236]
MTEGENNANSPCEGEGEGERKTGLTQGRCHHLSFDLDL